MPSSSKVRVHFTICTLKRAVFVDDVFAFGYLELLEGNTDFFTFDFAKNFELHVEAEFYASDEHCHETRITRLNLGPPTLSKNFP